MDSSHRAKPWYWRAVIYAYPIVFFIAVSTASVRGFLFVLHLFNPSLSFLPAYNPVLELLICLVYSLPAIGLHLLKKPMLEKYGLAVVWDYYHAAHPGTISIEERWGGQAHADKVAVLVTLGFLLFTAFFTITAISGHI